MTTPRKCLAVLHHPQKRKAEELSAPSLIFTADALLKS